MTVSIDLSGRHALVTGASRGIGAAVAEGLARAGAVVAIHYREDESAAKKVSRKIRNYERSRALELAGGPPEGSGAEAPELPEPLLLRADMGSAQDIWQMFDLYDERYPKLDLVVCSAGIWKRAAIEKVTEEEVREMFAVNLEGVVHTCRQAAMRMIRQGTGGSIVLISSTAGQRGEPFYSHYAAAKGAVIALAQSLAVELAPHQIRVNVVAPGWINTDMTRETLEGQGGERIVDRIPLGDAGRPRSVAGPVLFLSSDMASYITGAVISANGGSVMYP